MDIKYIGWLERVIAGIETNVISIIFVRIIILHSYVGQNTEGMITFILGQLKSLLNFVIQTLNIRL